MSVRVLVVCTISGENGVRMGRELESCLHVHNLGCKEGENGGAQVRMGAGACLRSPNQPAANDEPNELPHVTLFPLSMNSTICK